MGVISGLKPIPSRAAAVFLDDTGGLGEVFFLPKMHVWKVTIQGISSA